MPIYELHGVKPVVSPNAYVHPLAVLIGDAIVEENCFVAPYATMRGDLGRLVLKRGSNLQEHCCMHGFPGSDTIVEEDGHIGHGAILHGCTTMPNVLIGMNSVVMDGAVIGENSMVGANSFVKANAPIPANSLVAGSPAKVIRELEPGEIAWKSEGTKHYQGLIDVYGSTLREVQPDSEVSNDRPRLMLNGYQTKPARPDQASQTVKEGN